MEVFLNRSSVGLNRYICFFCCLLFSLVLGNLALGQSTAVLKGTVTDALGAAVPHAKVVVKNEVTGVEWNTESDNVGSYLVPSLPIGPYQISIGAKGFETSVARNVTLNAATTVTQNVQLQIGQVSEEVSIEVDTPVIDASTIAMGQVIDQKTTQEIPLNGRHFVDLSLLTPGTVTPPQNGFLTTPLRGQGSFGFVTAGQREDTVNYLVNGINLNDMVQNQITFQPSINTVAEFKVDNSTYSAEYGRNSGAIVNIATRSGTNDFHGELFNFLRNSAMDARNFFNTTAVAQSPFRRNNFGAALGGPIRRNRAHFFASYEGLRQRQGLTINSLVLSPAQQAQAQAGTDPAVKALAALIPASNATENGLPFFVGSALAPVNIDQGTGDIDVELGERDRLHGYVAIQQDLRQEPTLQGNTLPGWGDTRSSRRQIGTVGEDHIFGPSVTNSMRLGYNRIHILFNPNQLLNSANFNISSGVNSAIGLAQIDIQGGALDFGGPSVFPQGRGDTNAVLNDTLSWLKGRHSFSFGGEVRRFYNDNFALDPTIFRFSSVANFLSDTVTSFSFAGTPANRILSPAYDGFAQDSFKWTPYLTLQLGVRYSWYATPTEAANRFTVFDPATASLVQVGTNGISQPFQTNNKNFQPRVGIVWAPFKNQKTVVRAGYAILTDEPVTGIVTVLNSNPPFSAPLTAASTSTSTVSLTNAYSSFAKASGLSPTTIDPNFKNPYIQSYNFNLEEQLTPSTGLTVGYLGSKGTHLRIARNLNQLELVGGALVRPFAAVSASSPIDPNAALGNITEITSGANSHYNALVVELNRRLSHGLQFISSYVYSKSIDENSLNSQGTILQNSLDLASNRGLSDFDVRHRVVVSGFYELPFHGNRLTSGWEVGTIVQAQSGNPLNVTTSINNFTGTVPLVAGGGLRPDILSSVTDTGNPAQWFSNPVACENYSGPLPSSPAPALPACSSTPNAAFALPCTFSNVPNSSNTYPIISNTCHFGNLGRNAITGPSFVNTDLSLVKNTKLSERINLQFRTEAFDVFNHPNFGNPNLNPQSSTFGRITSTRFPTGDFGSARQLQVSLKFQF